MTAGVMKVTDKARLELGNAAIDWANDAFFHILLTDAFTPNRNKGLFSDLSASEVAGGGDYARQALTGATVADVGGKIVFDSDDADFGAVVSIEAKYHAILRAANGVSLQATDWVMCVRDLDTDAPGTNSVASDQGPFISRAHATDGWFYIAQPT